MRHERNHLSFLTIFLFGLTAGLMTGCSDTVSDRIDAYLVQMNREQDFQGIVLVAEGDSIRFHRGYGLANIEKDIPITTKTRFKIGPVTEQFTAAAIFKLIEAGRLHLDSAITAYLPDYPPATGNLITIRHLLTHRCGIPNYTLEGLILLYKEKEVDPEDILATFKEKRLIARPGETHAYSKSGYQVLGAIIEAVSGQTYEEFLGEHFLSPVALNNTEMPKQYPIADGYAVGYMIRNEKLTRAQTIPPTVEFASGGLGTTAEDLHRWAGALFGDGHRVLSPDMGDSLLALVEDNFVCGWQRTTREEREILRGIGRTFGYVTIIERGVNDPLTVIVMSNITQAPAGDIVESITDMVLADEENR